MQNGKSVADLIDLSKSDLPKWCKEDYKGDEQDFAKWIEAGIRNGLKDILPQIHGLEAIARVDALINHIVASRVQAAKGKADRAFLWLINEAQENGWHHLLDGEFDTIEELLATILDETTKGTTEAYDIAFLTKTAVPLLKVAGAKAEDIFGIPLMTGKARAIVPALRDLMRCSECGARTEHQGTLCKHGHELKLSEEAASAAIELARMVVDPKTSTDDIRDKVAGLRGRVIQAPERIDSGDLYIMRDEEWVLIRCTSTEQRRAVENALGKILKRGLVPRDLGVLANDVYELFFGQPAPISVETLVGSDPW